MRIYCGIDGTGNNDNTNTSHLDDPNPLLRRSHVRLITMFGFDRHQYIAGPKMKTTGLDAGFLAQKAKNWIIGRHQALPVESRSAVEFYLGGFSRGAAAAVYACHLLQEEGISIAGLFLFDAVDRSFAIPNHAVRDTPANVKFAFHAISAVEEAKTRQSFGRLHLKKNCITKEFYTTHGGLGGWILENERLQEVNGKFFYQEKFEPWRTKVTREQQKRGQMEAWFWMRRCILVAFVGNSRSVV